jgi:hypothetical protein
MKLISNRVNDTDGQGFLEFELDGYIYMVGDLGDFCTYIQRQLSDDYRNDLDNWESPTWLPAEVPTVGNFKFLKK